MEKTARRKVSAADSIFGIIVLLLSIVIFLIILYPLWFIVIASISNSNLVNLGKVTFLPKDIRFYGYQQIIEDSRIWRGYLNTLIYVVAGTVLNMVVTMPAAYALSRRGFKARNKVMFYFVFTMFFSGGLVPTYMTISEQHALDVVTVITTYNFDDVNGNGMPDEDEMDSAGSYGAIYVDGEEITYEQYAEYDAGEYEYIVGSMNLEELTDTLAQTN